MSKKSIQQSMRIPRDLHDAGTAVYNERRKTEVKVSLTDVLMGWARKGARAEGVNVAEVVPRDEAEREVKA